MFCAQFSKTECLKLGAEDSSYLPWQALLDEPGGGEASAPDPPGSGLTGCRWVIHHDLKDC